MDNYQKTAIGVLVVGLWLWIGVISYAADLRVQTVPQGGTGFSSSSPNSIVVTGTTSTSALIATSSSPLYIGSLNATTTATSTMQGGLNVSIASGCLAVNGTCVSTAGGGITSLNGLTGATQTFADNDYVDIVSAGTVHTFSGSTSPNFGTLTATSSIGTAGNRIPNLWVSTGDITTLTAGTIVINQFVSGNLEVTGDALIYGGDIFLGTGTATTTLTTSAANVLTITGGGYVAQASSTVVGAFNAQTLTVPPLTSALLQTDANGLFAEYAGTSCTNQFPRSLSALGVATCASVSLTADVTGTLPIANGGTNATSFTTSGNAVYYNGTSLITAGTSLAVTTPYASSTSITSTGSAYFATASGNVGIGTTGPWDPLSVIGDISLTGGDLRLGTGSATTTLTSASGRLGIASTTPWGLFSVESDNSSVGTNNPIFVVGDQGTSTPFLYVSGNNGNVGIGTANPAAKLHLYASGQVEMRFEADNPIFAIDAATDNLGQFVFREGGTTKAGFAYRASVDRFSLETGGWERMSFDQDGLIGVNDLTPDFKFEIVGSSGSGYFGVTNSADGDIFKINSSGNVGIGTTSPTNLLEVNGTSYTTNLIVSSGGFLNVPNGADPTLTRVGQLALNTTTASTSLRLYDGTAERVLNVTDEKSFVVASTTLVYIGAYGTAGTTTLKLAQFSRPITVLNYFCSVVGDTSVTVAFGTGSATTSYVIANGAGRQAILSSNNTWTARQAFYGEFGTRIGTPDYISCTLSVREDAD